MKRVDVKPPSERPMRQCPDCRLIYTKARNPEGCPRCAEPTCPNCKDTGRTESGDECTWDDCFFNRPLPKELVDPQPPSPSDKVRLARRELRIAIAHVIKAWEHLS